MARQRYLALTGLDYDGKRAEPGDIVDDIPGKSIKWLLKQGHVEKVEGSQARTPSKRASATRKAKAEGREISEAYEAAEDFSGGSDVAPEELVREADERIAEGKTDEPLPEVVEDIAEEEGLDV